MHQADSDIRTRLLVARLPAMPQILLKLIEQCQSEEVGMGDLAELIAKDPGMTGKILGVANSSAYHRSGRKLGLEYSLSLLGTDMIKTLVISESVFQVFNNFSHSNSTDLRAFWHHSLTSAVLAREIAGCMNYPHSEEAYLAGLLHDVGRLALLATAPKEYSLNFLASDDENLCAFEQRTLNMTHSEAGAWLIERWNLDSFLADSVLYHHEPAARLESTHPLIRIVLLAHLLSSLAEDDPAVIAAAALCAIDCSAIPRIIEGANSQVMKSAEHLGIDLSGIDQLQPQVSSACVAVPQDPVHKQLSEEVRDLVLSSEASRSFSRQQNDAELLEAVTRSARILFDFEDSIFLRTDSSEKALVGVPVGHHRQRMSDFSIRLNSSGRVAEAAHLRQVTFVVKDMAPVDIAEEQLMRVLGTPALACLPLATAQRCQGVMIAGIAPWQIPELKRRTRLLGCFGEQASTALDTCLHLRGEEQIRASNIAEEYREASRRVAHEVNNPLSIIKNYLSILDSKLENHEPVVGEMKILNDEIDRVGQIVKGLAHLDPSDSEGGAEVNRIIRDVVRLFRGTEFVPESLQIITQTQEIPTEVEASPTQLKQILVNLLKNAIEAMPNGGEIQILNNGHLNRDGLLYVELCVKDNGPGLPVDVLSSLFSPVHSTKGGTHQGLGLSIVHGLVKDTQGLITCRSNIKGTSFEIMLPVRKCSGQTKPTENRA